MKIEDISKIENEEDRVSALYDVLMKVVDYLLKQLKSNF